MKPGAAVLNYVEQVCGKIKSANARQSFWEELLGHAAERVTSLMEETGLSKEDAETETIVRMGSADVPAQEMNIVHKENSSLLLVLRTIFLTLAASAGIWNACAWGTACFRGYLPDGVNFFTPEPMIMTEHGSFDYRLFFWLPLVVSVLLFVIPAIRRHAGKAHMRSVRHA